MDNNTESLENSARESSANQENQDLIYSKETFLSYRCKRCRFKLFDDRQIINHNEESENQNYEIKKKSEFYAKSNNQSDKKKLCEKEIFIEPIEWFKNRLDDITGKINCPKCDLKIGSFDWSGSKCVCGAWITPSFHIAKSKIDYHNSFLFE